MRVNQTSRPKLFYSESFFNLVKDMAEKYDQNLKIPQKLTGVKVKMLTGNNKFS